MARQSAQGHTETLGQQTLSATRTHGQLHSTGSTAPKERHHSHTSTYATTQQVVLTSQKNTLTIIKFQMTTTRDTLFTGAIHGEHADLFPNSDVGWKSKEPKRLAARDQAAAQGLRAAGLRPAHRRPVLARCGQVRLGGAIRHRLAVVGVAPMPLGRTVLIYGQLWPM